MNQQKHPAIVARLAAERTTPSNYPEEFARRMQGRRKQPLGALFGLRNFGVNLTTLAPGAISALRHAHSRQDEFVFVLQGRPTLRTEAGDQLLEPGMCVGFAAGSGDAHQLINFSGEAALYLEIGDRTPGDEVVYPDDDLMAVLVAGAWQFTRKNGMPFSARPEAGKETP